MVVVAVVVTANASHPTNVIPKFIDRHIVA